jgi:hypothetical protein
MPRPCLVVESAFKAYSVEMARKQSSTSEIRESEAMGLRQPLTIVGLLAVLGLSLSPTPSLAGEPTDETMEDFSNAVALRLYVGLDADPSRIADTLDHGGGKNSDYGLSLTDEEATSIRELFAAQAKLERAHVAARERPTFVAAYYDRSILHISTTSPSDLFLQSIEGEIPPGSDVVITQVEQTRSELEATVAQITSDFARLAEDGIWVSQVGIDPIASKVRVIVSRDATDAATERLAKLYGDHLEVEVKPVHFELFACSKLDCGTRGGLSIRNGVVGCTSAFLARNKPQPPYAYAYFMATAGHCIRDASDTTNWRNVAGTTTWGKNVASVFGASGDAGVFSLGASVPAAKSTYYVGGGSYRTLSAKASDAAQAVGKVVCRHGHTSDYDCGVIRATHQSVNAPGAVLQNMWKVQLTSAEGDSGAGFIYQPEPRESWRAAGVLSGGTCEGIPCTNYTWYTTVNFMELRMPSYVICTTASC